MKLKFRLLYNNLDNGLFQAEMAKANIEKHGFENLEEIYKGEIEVAMTLNDTQVADRIFDLTNKEEDNPLSISEIQTRIQNSKCKHTSLSIGDVVAIQREGKKEEYYLCDDMGWYHFLTKEETKQ